MELNFEDKINPIMRIPPETNEHISHAIEDNLRPFREQLGSQNVKLQTDLLKLKESLVSANEERLRTNHEIEKIHNEINAQRTLEGVKRKELQKVLFGRRDKRKGRDRVRTRIPPQIPGKNIFSFPQLPKPFNHRKKAAFRMNQQEEQLFKVPLFTKSVQVPNRTVPEYDYDHFADERLSKALVDQDKKQNPEFFSKMKLGIPLDKNFPDLPVDYHNKQGLLEPKYRGDFLDDLEANFKDLNLKNEHRLRALEPEKKIAPNIFYTRNQIEKVDKIVDALDKFTNGENFYQDEEESKQDNGIFRMRGEKIMKEAGRNNPKNFYKKKNHVPSDEYFKKPEKFKNWDEKFNFEDYI